MQRGAPAGWDYTLEPEPVSTGVGIVYRFFLWRGRPHWIYLQKRASDGPFAMKNDTYSKLRQVNKVYSFSLRTVCNLLRLFAGIMVVLILLQLLSNNVSLSEFCSGVMLGVGVSSLIALVIIWVPIVNKLRSKVNKLIDDIGVNL